MFTGNVDSAREILSNLSAKYPSLLSARLQLIGLEKRCDRQDVVTALYDEGLASALTQDEKSFLSSHYAGYIAKVRDGLACGAWMVMDVFVCLFVADSRRC